MKRFITFCQQIRLQQVFAVVLSAVLMVSTVACSAANASQPANRSGSAVEPGKSEQGIPGKQYQRYEGGMNGYSDIDPRYPATGSNAGKAKALRDNAERNVIDMSDDVGTNTRRILDKKGENLDQVGGNLKYDSDTLGNKVDRTAQDAKAGVDRFKSIGDENDGFRATDRAVDREFSRSTQRAAENVKNNTQAAGENLVDNVKQAAKKTADFVQDRS